MSAPLLAQTKPAVKLEISVRHRTARALAKIGAPVFPCVVGGKKPAVPPPGFKWATTDLEKIDAWWAQGDYNVGVWPAGAGWVVVDLDTYKKDGVSQAVLDMLPDTRTHQTPHGGLQKLYKTSEKFSNRCLAVNVDIRGANGYVLWPGSEVDCGADLGLRQYKVLDARDPAPLPDNIAQALRVKRDEDEVVLTPDDGEDKMPDEARAWCKRYKENESPDRFVLAAALVRNFGLTNATATALAEEFGLRMHSDSPDGTSWNQTLNNARKHGTGKLGEGVAFTQPPIEGDETDFDQFVQPAHLPEKKKNRFGRRLPSVAAKRDPITYWDEEKTLPRGPVVGFIYGKRSSHKTGQAIRMGLDAIERHGARVLYIALEGDWGVDTARLPAARAARGMSEETLDAHWSTEIAHFRLQAMEDHEMLQEAYKDWPPDIIIIDVFAKTVSGDINTPGVGTSIMQAADALAKRFNCVVAFVAHPGKDDTKEILGSVLYVALADFVLKAWTAKGKAFIAVEKMKDGEADRTLSFGIDMSAGPPVIRACTAFEKTEEVTPEHNAGAEWVREWLRNHRHVAVFTKGDLVDALKHDGGIPGHSTNVNGWLMFFAHAGLLAGYHTKIENGRNTDWAFFAPPERAE